MKKIGRVCDWSWPPWSAVKCSNEVKPHHHSCLISLSPSIIKRVTVKFDFYENWQPWHSNWSANCDLCFLQVCKYCKQDAQILNCRTELSYSVADLWMGDDHGCNHGGNAAVDKATNSEIWMAIDTRHSSHKKGKSESINTRTSSKTPKSVWQKYLRGHSPTVFL